MLTVPSLGTGMMSDWKDLNTPGIKNLENVQLQIFEQPASVDISQT